jgi:hypothetical protein
MQFERISFIFEGIFGIISYNFVDFLSKMSKFFLHFGRHFEDFSALSEVARPPSPSTHTKILIRNNQKRRIALSKAPDCPSPIAPISEDKYSVAPINKVNLSMGPLRQRRLNS